MTCLQAGALDLERFELVFLNLGSGTVFFLSWIRYFWGKSEEMTYYTPLPHATDCYALLFIVEPEEKDYGVEDVQYNVCTYIFCFRGLLCLVADEDSVFA